MQNFSYQNPTKLIFGKGQLEKLKFEIPKFGNKVLVTYGGGSIKKFGLYNEVMDILNELGVSVFEFSGIEPNPRLETAERAIKICKEEGIEFILAVGGGSVIDCTKLIAAGAVTETNPWDIVLGNYEVKKALPFGTVLTLAASGSEMNSGSVITNWETKEKYGWGSEFSYPKFSILDPANTITVPKDQTVNGIVDIMSHVFEQYFHHDTNTPLQDRMCEGLLRTVIECGSKLVTELDNYEYRETVLYCGTIALNGYLRVGVTPDFGTHRLEHAVSAIYDIPHAAGLAILFPNWMKYVMHERLDRFVQLAVEVFKVERNNKTDEQIAREGIEKLSEFWKSIGAPATFSDVGIAKPDLELLVDKALALGSFGFFKQLTKDDCMKIYQGAEQCV